MGSTARRTIPTRSMATAAATANAIDTASPVTVSMIVGTVWRTARSRLSQSEAMTPDGDGSTKWLSPEALE